MAPRIKDGNIFGKHAPDNGTYSGRSIYHVSYNIHMDDIDLDSDDD